MERLEYVIVTEEMVWVFLYDKHNARAVKELVGKEALAFVDLMNAKSRMKSAKE